MRSLSPESLLLAASLALATLISVHLSPQTVFFAEYAVAAALIVACWRGAPEGGPASRGLLLWGGVLVIASALWPGRAGGLGYAAYAALFVLAYARAALNREDGFVGALAWGMLVCALLQSLAGLIQLAGWDFGGLVMKKIYLQAFGNVGQANHYGDLVFLGLGSLAWLYGRSKLPGVAMLVIAAWLALAAAASASRSVWLYTVVFAALGLWAQWRAEDLAARRSAQALLVIAVCSVMAQMLVGYGHVLDVFGVTSSLARADDAGSNGQRLYNWHAAWLAIQAHPWLGEGPGTFYRASIDAMFVTAPASYPKFAEHAHNLPLNLAAEFGVPMALFILAAPLLWAWRHLRRKASATSLWALACVGVVGAHSMVEYPLWYLYFLIPVGLCMGAADAGCTRLPTLRVPRLGGIAIAALGIVGLVAVGLDWVALRSAYNGLAAYEPRVPLAVREAARKDLDVLSPFSVFAPQAESLRLQSWHPDEPGAAQIADRCDAHWANKPGWYMMMRCGEAYAVSGREASLERLTRALCDGFPYHRDAQREWASGYDARALAGLRISGRNCLTRPTSVLP